MRPRCTLAAAVVLLALASSPARAEEEWYGHHVLGAEAGSWAFILGGVKAKAWPLTAIGVGGLVLGGPIVHAAHDNWGRAGVSLGTRVVTPLLGLGLGAALDSKSSSFLPLGPIVGIFVGYAAAAIVDIVIIAREDDDPAAAPRMISFGGSF